MRDRFPRAACPIQRQEFEIGITDDELRQADCVVIVTDHGNVDYKRVTNLASLVVDTRNALGSDLRRDSSARVVRL